MAKSHQLLVSVPSTSSAPIWDIKCSFHSLIVVLIVSLVAGVVYLTGESGKLLFEDNSNSNSNSSMGKENEESLTYSSSNNKCNLFSGKWIFDNESYPLYKEQDCKFMSDQLACQKFGRKDLNYQHWRWQPHQCDIPRFNATTLLEKLRNKRLVFVGDSLNRGQWVSMVCLIDTAVHDSSLKSMHYRYNTSLIIFQVKDYNATIEFYWEPLLVESNSDDPVHHRLPERIVRANSIEKHGSRWTNADFIVFNTYLWWRRPHIKVLWGSFERSDGIYKEVKMLRSYEMALKAWADWLEIHVNRTKTQLFFMSMSPVHERDSTKGEFLVLKHGSMSVASYKAKFHALSRYATQLLGTGEERIRLFVKGLKTKLQVISIHMKYVGKSFNEVTDYVKKMEGSDLFGSSYPVSLSSFYKWSFRGFQLLEVMKLLILPPAVPLMTEDASINGDLGHFKRECPLRHACNQMQQQTKGVVPTSGGDNGRGRDTAKLTLQLRSINGRSQFIKFNVS
ncbi:hypothetical protein MTR67_038472 [Solanum verrucosum]|uniref:Trichome birefringence-like N-terminal domain-containing protein n=1 Tax=Solanum verrucosum TaxID=315347 RepID=A0AAF0UFJ6_SOLVR|nr:hypothetical protein MTR67_038472 [Solanum verrucosum]